MLGSVIGAAATGFLFNLWGANELMSFNCLITLLLEVLYLVLYFE